MEQEAMYIIDSGSLKNLNLKLASGWKVVSVTPTHYERRETDYNNLGQMFVVIEKSKS